MAFATCNKKRTPMSRFALLAALLTTTLYGGDVYAQALPWQNSPPPPGMQPPPPPPPPPPPSPPPQTSSPYHYYQNTNGAAAAQPMMNPRAARSEDDRRLNLLATRFYGITPRDPDVIMKLKRLQRDVHDFRTGLAYHGYDATDILTDAQKLEGRIARQRRHLEEEAARANTQPPQSPTPTANGAPSYNAPAPHPPQ